MGEEVNSFLTFVRDKNIEVIDSKGIRIVCKDKILEGDLYRQLDIICEFHKRTTGFKDYLRGRIDNKTGKFVEENKVSLKRLTTFLKILREKNNHNKFEKYLLDNEGEYVHMAERSLKCVEEPSYIQFIIRSMEREEICLERVWFNNLAMDNGKIYIRDIGSVAYNMIEMDCIEFLKRARKRNVAADYEKLCDYFCKKSNLGEDSRRFILNMLLFPTEFMLCCKRYRVKKKNWSLETFCKRLEEAMEHERVYVKDKSDSAKLEENYDREQI